MSKHRGNKTPRAYAWVFAEQLLKNPRWELILTGIYAIKSKLKYGVDECSFCINFLTEILPGTALAVFAFAYGKTHTTLRASNLDAA